MADPEEMAEQNLAANHDSATNDAPAPKQRNFLLLALAGESSPFRGIKPLSALITFSEMHDFISGIAESESKDISKVCDFRCRKKLAKATGQNVSTISAHWRALEQIGFIEQAARGKYKTTPRKLTKKGRDVWEQAEKIPVLQSLLTANRPFGEVLVFSYVLFRAGVFANDPKFRFGFCKKGSREIARQTGLVRYSVQNILDALIAGEELLQVPVVLESGKLEHRIEPSPRFSGQLLQLLAPANSGESGGQLLRHGGPIIATLSIPYSNTYSNNTATPCSAAPSAPATAGAAACGESDLTPALPQTGNPFSGNQSANRTGSANGNPLANGKSSTLPQEIENLCSVISKRANSISFNPSHPEWFLRLRFTAALVELSHPQVLRDLKFRVRPNFGIEPFSTSLQQDLVCAFGNCDKLANILHPENFFRKVELEKTYGADGCMLLCKSDFRKSIDSHFDEIVARISELSASSKNSAIPAQSSPKPMITPRVTVDPTIYDSPDELELVAVLDEGDFCFGPAEY